MTETQEMRTQVRALHETLERVYRIADAGEKGFATAGANMPSPALKMILKLYAQQRMNFKRQILDEMRRLGMDARPGVSVPGAIHRGRVAIFAGMAHSTAQEKIILKEAALGERVAVRTYQEALEIGLPVETRALLERQFGEVRRASQLVHCLRDDPERRSSIHLAGNDQDTQQVVRALVSQGMDPEQIETLPLGRADLYDGRGATVPEMILSGAVGGALWGGVTGALAGIGVLQTTVLPDGAQAMTWMLTFLGFLVVGAFISAILALFIAVSISGEDNYQYPAIREKAQVLILSRVCGVGE
jgi:uncharacterized protein (TIGR02284 family)